MASPSSLKALSKTPYCYLLEVLFHDSLQKVYGLAVKVILRSKGWLWGRIFILEFAHISRKFRSDPENEEISAPPPYGVLIGIYLF
jgi:hypothetical protein